MTTDTERRAMPSVGPSRARNVELKRPAKPAPQPATTKGPTVSASQRATIDASSKRLALPARPELRQTISITGEWFDPSDDPTPSMLDVECQASGRRGTYVVKANTMFELPAGTLNVFVKPIYASPGMKLTVLIAPIPRDTSSAELRRLQDEAKFASAEKARRSSAGDA